MFNLWDDGIGFAVIVRHFAAAFRYEKTQEDSTERRENEKNERTEEGAVRKNPRRMGTPSTNDAIRSHMRTHEQMNYCVKGLVSGISNNAVFYVYR